jgi:hypothetical protein
MSAAASQADIARWLVREFPEPVKEYEAGRLEIEAALQRRLDCSADEATDLFDDLEQRGHVRYAAEARSIGGGPGTWVVYDSPGENPDMSIDPSVPEPPGR